MITFRYAAGSDIGLERSVNEDSAYASKHLAAVADGMGGRAAGDLASAIVIETLARMDRSRNRIMFGDLQEAVEKANTKLRKATVRDSRLTGMGSTLTAMAVDGKRITLAHIGDSRAYAFRDGRLFQLTNDHTYVQRLIEDGRITEEEAAQHPDRSALVKVLNGNKGARPDLSVHSARRDDRFLLCSDGLSSVVSQEEIERLITLQSPEAVVRQLIELAREKGGPDNITCVVADAVDTDRAGFDRSAVVTLGAISAIRPDL